MTNFLNNSAFELRWVKNNSLDLFFRYIPLSKVLKSVFFLISIDDQYFTVVLKGTGNSTWKDKNICAYVWIVRDTEKLMKGRNPKLWKCKCFFSSWRWYFHFFPPPPPPPRTLSLFLIIFFSAWNTRRVSTRYFSFLSSSGDDKQKSEKSSLPTTTEPAGNGERDNTRKRNALPTGLKNHRAPFRSQLASSSELLFRYENQFSRSLSNHQRLWARRPPVTTPSRKNIYLYIAGLVPHWVFYTPSVFLFHSRPLSR